jgi:hypothetical protein
MSITIGDGLEVFTAKLASLSADEIKRRLKFLAGDEMRLFAGTRDADFDELDAIDRAMERNRKVRDALRKRLNEIADAMLAERSK